MNADRNEVPGCLLLVEDDEILREMLRRYLQIKGLTVSEAASGEEALAALPERRFDVVVLDTLLPGLSGLEVLKVIRQSHSATDLPVIMATAQGQSDDVVEALQLGANDYLTKPFDFSVALARIHTQLSLKRSVDRIARLEQSLAERNAALEAANQSIRHDLEAAARVQQSLLPEAPPDVPGVCFAWQFRPCAELAGDLLNVVMLDERRVALYVLDVVGHGVKAALLAVMVTRILSQMLSPSSPTARPLLSPASVAEHLNRVFPWDDRTRQFFTLLYGVLNLDVGVFTFVSAGHPGPIHLPHGGAARSLDTTGALIGMGAERHQEHSVSLGEGDRLYLYTDGLTEAKNRDNEDFGKQRALKVIEASSAIPLSASLVALIEGIEAWCGSSSLKDDLSLLAVEIRRGVVDRRDG
jgi:phosphoserine phosphatase RsbU/P